MAHATTVHLPTARVVAVVTAVVAAVAVVVVVETLINATTVIART